MLRTWCTYSRCRASEASTFRTSDCEIPNSRAILGGVIPALKAARTAFTWPRVSERTACAGRTLEDSFFFRDPLGVGSSLALAARPDGSLPRRFASSSAATRSDASSTSSSRLSALGKSFGNRYRRNDAAMSTAAVGEETWLAGDASENRSGVATIAIDRAPSPTKNQPGHRSAMSHPDSRVSRGGLPAWRTLVRYPAVRLSPCLGWVHERRVMH